MQFYQNIGNLKKALFFENVHKPEKKDDSDGIKNIENRFNVAYRDIADGCAALLNALFAEE